MASVYRQHSKYDGEFDPSRCKASVHGERVTVWQCQRKPWKDGWCKQHHPITEKAREKARDARYEAESKKRDENAIRGAVNLLRREGYTVIPPREAQRRIADLESQLAP